MDLNKNRLTSLKIITYLLLSQERDFCSLLGGPSLDYAGNRRQNSFVRLRFLKVRHLKMS